MSKQFFELGEVEIEKQQFYSSKSPISINDVYIPNVHSKP